MKKKKVRGIARDTLHFILEATFRVELKIEDLQSSALPLGYVAKIKMERKTRLELATPPWQGGALPLSYFRIQYKIGGDTQNRTGE